MIKLFILFYIVTSGFLFAQYTGTIKGTVNSRETDEPLENVNVFISGTMWGTTTDRNGFYVIKNLPAGQHTIVTSLVGYKQGELDINLKENSTVEIIFNLKEISYELKQVNITAEVPKEWKENLETFKELFLGNTKFADDCEILNPEVINLNQLATGELDADALRPITVINNALGYKIVCDLVYFKWDKKNKNLIYFVNSFFSELDDSSRQLKAEWLKNRKKVYDGSFVNFIRSLIKDSLYENDFVMWLERKPSSSGDIWPQTEKPEIKILDDSSVTFNFDQYLRVEYSPRLSEKVVSWIKLNHPNVIFDKFGYPADAFPIEVYGFWAFKGLSFTLPKYYYPDEK